MKLNELKTVLHSNRGDVQKAVIYDMANGIDIEDDIAIDAAVKCYGDREVHRIEAAGDKLVVNVL